MNNQPKELKPCPFCGKSGVLREMHKNYWIIWTIECINQDCLATILDLTPQLACERWNTRATPPVKKWTAEELAELLHRNFLIIGVTDADAKETAEERLATAINERQSHD